MAAIVKREIDAGLSPGIKQSTAFGIFSNCMHISTVGNACDDGSPSLTRIMCRQDQRSKIVESMSVDRDVRGCWIMW